MVLASQGKMPNAGGDTKANMIKYLLCEFGVVLNRRTLRKEVGVVLHERLQMGDGLHSRGNYKAPTSTVSHQPLYYDTTTSSLASFTITIMALDTKLDTKMSAMAKLRTKVANKRSRVWKQHGDMDAYTGLNKAEYDSEASVADVNRNTFAAGSVHLTHHPRLVVEVDHVLEIHLARALMDKVMSDDSHERRILRNDQQLRSARSQVVCSLRAHMNGAQTNLNNTTRQINMAKYEACKQVSVDISNCILSGSSLNATGTLADKLKRQDFRDQAVRRIVAQMATSCNNIVNAIGESENSMVNDFSALLVGDFIDKVVQ
jgi:hypothetical protein